MLKYLSIILLSLLSTQLVAQKETIKPNEKEEKKYSWKFKKERVTYGGGIGGSLGGTYSSVNISPILGYKFTDELMGGVRVIYNYYSIPNQTAYANYGYGALSRYFFSSKVYSHLEYQDLYFKGNNNRGVRGRVPSLLLGAGYYNKPVTFSVLYDFLWNKTDNLYDSPIRVNFGLMF